MPCSESSPPAPSPTIAEAHDAGSPIAGAPPGEAGSIPVLPVRWPGVAAAIAFMTTRSGGISTGAQADPEGGGGLNLGLACGDDPRRVEANRQHVARRIGRPVLWLAQVHGATVIDGDRAIDPSAAPPRADAAFTTRDDLALAALAADCLPVLLSDRSGRIVGAAHGGWRGLVAGVLPALVTAMRARLPDADLMAWLGPRIIDYEVGPEVREAFARAAGDRAGPLLSRAFRPGSADRWICDLGALARAQLEVAGVSRIADSAWGTDRDPARFWSHRRDRPGGRMAAVIARARMGDFPES